MSTVSNHVERRTVPLAVRLLRLVIALGNAYRRLLGVLLAVGGPRFAYAFTGTLARLLYWALPPIRHRSEAQYRLAVGDGADVERAARQSFLHRVWNLADLMLAERYLHPGTYERYGGCIPEPHRGILREAREKRHPVILVTAYYGPFDLLPVFLGYNGISAGVVYRPHPNAHFDAMRRRVRERGGCELIPLQQAGSRLTEILERGGTVAILADHQAGPRGLPETFLGVPTRVNRSVALLAEHYGASIGVAGIRRVGPLRFEIVVADIIHAAEFRSSSDPIAAITSHYLRALERIIRRDPSQYLWSHARWGEAFARELESTAGEDAAVTTTTQPRQSRPPARWPST